MCLRRLFMRRQISLYIGGQRADLAEQGLVLWNYILEEMSNPTIVRNSFTRSIVLEGTRRNNRIFGQFWRSDRLSGAGMYKPLTRVPFVVYSANSEILTSGYCKLDKVTRKGNACQYSVTLYGGLGSFFYNLSQKEDGSKMTLADLDFTGQGAGAAELDFTIDRKAVLDAWDSLQGRDVELDSFASHILAKINQDGSIGAGTRGTGVREFKVLPNSVYWVTGYSVSDGCLAAVLDAEGNTLSTFFYGTDTTYTNQRIDVPEDGAVLRLCGSSFRDDWPVASGTSPIWEILNFAPMYEGYPSGDFASDKAVFRPADTGVVMPSGYTTKGGSGFALAALGQKFTGIEMKDLRSYLQRPVIRWKKIVEAICQPYNNGGYEVVLDSDFFSESNPYYEDAYMTLPIISSLDVQGEGVSESIIPQLGTMTLQQGGDSSVEYSVNLAVRPKAVVPSGQLSWYMDTQVLNAWTWCIYITYTLKAYDSAGNELATTSANVSSADYRQGELPAMDVTGNFDGNGNWVGLPVGLSLKANGIAYLVLSQTLTRKGFGTNAGSYLPSVNTMWSNANDYRTGAECTHEVSSNSEGCEATFKASDTARTGATITKGMLLGAGKTPAEYLLSYCKMFGLVFMADRVEKKITILKRSNFYRDGLVDWSNRINILDGYEITPYGFDGKWYEFATPYDNGEWAKYYDNLYDRVFGSMRVDTGYEFDASTKKVLDGMAFRGLCQVQERSVCYCDIMNGSSLFPSCWQYAGKYTLYNASNEPSDFDLPLPPASSVRTWWNDVPTWDYMSRPQVHNADNANFEQRDALLFFNGIRPVAGQGWAVSDDTAMMMTLNEGEPCWWIGFGGVDSSAVVTGLPNFSRYRLNNDGEIALSWDFAEPKEVQLPDAVFLPQSGIYAQYWADYMSDRYNRDSRVLKCKANLRGYMVGADLFRNFYYWDGAIWALNRITNYSLTTYDDTEVELVRVMDKANYLG